MARVLLQRPHWPGCLCVWVRTLQAIFLEVVAISLLCRDGKGTQGQHALGVLDPSIWYMVLLEVAICYLVGQFVLLDILF